MDTTERMMIMGMCLQGLLAHPARSKDTTADTRMVPNPDADMLGEPEQVEETFYRPLTVGEQAEQIANNIKLAHLYADALDPPPETTDAERILSITRVAYEAVRAVDADGAGRWVDFDAARASIFDTDTERFESIFERVSRWYADPTGYAETIQDRIIKAVTLASLSGEQRPLPL